MISTMYTHIKEKSHYRSIVLKNNFFVSCRCIYVLFVIIKCKLTLRVRSGV